MRLIESFTFESALPTVDAVKKELMRKNGYDNRDIELFFGKGGQIEFALNGWLEESSASERFFDKDLEFLNERARYERLPMHPMDVYEHWDFARYELLGQSKVKEGPFRGPF